MSLLGLLRRIQVSTKTMVLSITASLWVRRGRLVTRSNSLDLPIISTSESTIDTILSTTKTIFLVRCPKDTLFSWIIARDMFSEYDVDRLKRKLLDKYSSAPQYDRIDFWKKNVEGWRKYEDRFLVVRYENLLNHYEKESKRISEYLSLSIKDSLPKVKEVDLSRKGIIGDHKRVFDSELINMIDERCKQEIEYIDSFLY